MSIDAVSQLSGRYPGRRVFITGAASGFGRAFAEHFARASWTVGLSDLDEVGLKLTSELVNSLGAESRSYRFDVSNYDQFGGAVESFAAEFGGIDIAVNNAGIGCAGHLHEVTIDDFRKVINVNLMGVVNGCHLFVPIMRKQKSGHILNVASAAAFVSAPRMSAYNSAKAAVLSLSETLKSELMDDNVLVSVLMPTYVRTNIGRDTIGTDEGKYHAELLVNESSLSADQAVEITLCHMGRGELYIVFPAEAKFLWRFKRLMPERFIRFIHQEVKKKLAMLDKNRL